MKFSDELGGLKSGGLFCFSKVFLYFRRCIYWLACFETCAKRLITIVHNVTTKDF